MAKKVTQAGQLDRFCTIYTRDALKDTHGKLQGYVPTPVYSNLPCNKQDGPGDEKNELDQRKTAYGTTVFTIRYKADITTTMKLSCEGVDYDILRVAEGEGRKQWLVLTTQSKDK
ncbi:head-tail adaptor protein [Fibrisoma montanum]|uniref:Head-tail adaptor protein n=1 Tax=Fibrisoma montanum TaxID=2305895 RepID=A0A418M3C5_9BACT|nr:phage head closure protein [Fibrisoma montanum]RIV20326.1 head-tail adaptor protein [Fibrisoma montanum]